MGVPPRIVSRDRLGKPHSVGPRTHVAGLTPYLPWWGAQICRSPGAKKPLGFCPLCLYTAAGDCRGFCVQLSIMGAVNCSTFVHWLTSLRPHHPTERRLYARLYTSQRDHLL